ncbi:hypothetical protein [Brucella intermedia]
MNSESVMGFVSADFTISLPDSLALAVKERAAFVRYSTNLVSIKKLRIPFNATNDDFDVSIELRVFSTSEYPESYVLIHYENKTVQIHISIDEVLFENFFGRHPHKNLTLHTRYYCAQHEDDFVYVKPDSMTVSPAKTTQA